MAHAIPAWSSAMRKTIKSEMIGDWELSLIAIHHPTDPTVRILDFKARMRLPGGGFTREIGDSSRAFDSESEAWEAGKAFIAER